jgi:sugar lactone lactonase YvrE
VCWSPDGKRLATASWNVVKVWDVEQGQAAADRDKKMKVWDVEQGQAARTLPTGTVWVESVCWSPDGKRLAGAGPTEWDGKVYHGEVTVWDAASEEKVFCKKVPFGVNGVAFSPDGKHLASAGGAASEAEVKVWDVASRQEVLTLKGHTSEVNGVCWSPDGKHLASAGKAQTVKVWDAANGQAAYTLTGHTYSVKNVCWSPDGNRLASAGKDGTVKVWAVPAPAVADPHKDLGGQPAPGKGKPEKPQVTTAKEPDSPPSAPPGTDPEVARLSNELLQAPDAASQEEVLNKLRDNEEPKCTPALALAIPKLKGPARENARKALAERLARMMSRKALVDKLQHEHEDVEVRQAAALACAIKGDRRSIPPLIRRIEDADVGEGPGSKQGNTFPVAPWRPTRPQAATAEWFTPRTGT